MQRQVAEDHDVVMTPAGDARKLRGIPAVGVKGGVGGAIRSTKPEQELLRRERRGLLGRFGLKDELEGADTLSLDETSGSGPTRPPARPTTLPGP